ncbi:MAG TPA: NUDIX domain-containing protein [Spirochaetia bacterium]|nr:NUDIX domain-containing protein [Spirochaetia bacterium]
MAIASELNQFGGRIIDSSTLPEDPKEFRTVLGAALDDWRREGAKIVWLALPIALAGHVPVAVEAGFVYHHADAGILQLTLVLTPGSYVPPHATHYIGAGGVVLSEDRMLLVVMERYRGTWGRHYKLPGGALHLGEHISSGVIREIEEETGIQTRFRSLVCFRHWHGYRFGKSDIYFVCRLDPLSFDIRRDPGEIEECMWMPVDEYLSHPDVHVFNRRIVEAALSSDGLPRAAIDGYGTPESHELFIP